MLHGFIRRPWYAADSGGGSGGGTSGGTQPGGEPGSNASSVQSTGGQPAAQPSGDGKATGEQASEKSFSQADVDRIVQARLAEEQRRADTKAEKERKQAEEQRAKEQGDWQRLAEQRGTELESLKGKAEAADTYAAKLNGLIEAEIAQWPEELRALDPGKDALDARLAWVEKSRALAQRLGALPKAADTDAGKGNRPASTPQPGGTDQGGQQRPQQTYRFQSSGDVSW